MEKLKLEATQQAKKELALEALGLKASPSISHGHAPLPQPEQQEREEVQHATKPFTLPKSI